ncbi:hypothetical protein [Frankia sp. QA3]|uniref:hypothetical protein n=1 Tax=Frankia sp. QA3 TaxID=710111 RepID=UPI000269D063|nr:hypothetical protein [Frankia sp. QA3]EIV95295.1 hypothetical protein FraQA3DRAFT_5104 [Frankia sp. QA3]
MPADVPGTPSPDAERVSEHGDDTAAIPAAREGKSAPSLAAPAEAAATAVAVDTGSELVASLMSGMSADEQNRLLGMINSSIAAERSAAIDGTVRRQVDVGVRRRRSSRHPTDPDAPDAPDAADDPGEPGADGSRGGASDG